MPHYSGAWLKAGAGLHGRAHVQYDVAATLARGSHNPAGSTQASRLAAVKHTLCNSLCCTLSTRCHLHVSSPAVYWVFGSDQLQWAGLRKSTGFRSSTQETFPWCKGTQKPGHQCDHRCMAVCTRLPSAYLDQLLLELAASSRPCPPASAPSQAPDAALL